MRHVFSVVALTVLAGCSAAPEPALPEPMAEVVAPSAAEMAVFEPYVFPGPGGVKVDAQKGSFTVPENRSDPNSRRIKIGFIRFPSTSSTPGDPIVYLAGGPGGTGMGTAMGGRFPLFMALREVADVIAYDQRGTGLSSPTKTCMAVPPFGADTPMTRANIVDFQRKALTRCFDVWEQGGADIDGYTTLENAHDIEDLRKALGARRLNLWGISYGSHLGLAVMKYHRATVGRAVLSGIEGLDQTIKRPALTDKAFAHLQEIIDADPAARALYPDLAGMMRRVHAKLNANPVTVSFTPAGATAPVSVTFDGFAVQLLTSGMIADPPGFARVPSMYLAMDNGQYEPVAVRVDAYRRQLDAFRGMPEAMDLASGATAARLALTNREAESSLLGDALNFPMPHVMGVRPQIDLGDSFRAPFRSDIPALFISGTLDGRTYPDEAAEETKGFANRRRLVVENGGHNIYEADKRIADVVVAFFKGEATPETIAFAPPVIVKP